MYSELLTIPKELKKLLKRMDDKVNYITSVPEPIRITNYSKINTEVHYLLMKFYSLLKMYDYNYSALTGKQYKMPPQSSVYTTVDIRSESLISIKLPILPRKNLDDGMVVDDLDLAFREKAIAGFEIPEMPQKTIVVTHVYNTNTPTRFIRDNDNYNLKGTVNTIVRWTNSTDHGTNCWLEMKTIITDEQEEGTYIDVIKR